MNADIPSSVITRRIERLLFAQVNPTAAGLMRIAFAAFLPVVFWSGGMHLFPLGRKIPGLPEVYESVFLTSTYWSCSLGVMVLFGIGWRPHCTGQLLVVLLLPLAYLDCGRESRQVMLFVLFAFSLVRSDARLRLGPRRPVESNSAGPMWPIRLVQLQLTLLYAVNAIAKTTCAFLSGDVLVGFSKMLPNFHVDLTDGVIHAGAIAIPVAAAAVASVIVEYALAIGFWLPRLRWVTAIVGVAFHTMLATCMTIHMLDWTSMFLYLAFLLPFDCGTSANSPRPPNVGDLQPAAEA